jgi:hypothetical protein
MPQYRNFFDVLSEIASKGQMGILTGQQMKIDELEKARLQGNQDRLFGLQQSQENRYKQAAAFDREKFEYGKEQDLLDLQGKYSPVPFSTPDLDPKTQAEINALNALTTLRQAQAGAAGSKIPQTGFAGLPPVVQNTTLQTIGKLGTESGIGLVDGELGITPPIGVDSASTLMIPLLRKFYPNLFPNLGGGGQQSPYNLPLLRAHGNTSYNPADFEPAVEAQSQTNQLDLDSLLQLINEIQNEQ